MTAASPSRSPPPPAESAHEPTTTFAANVSHGRRNRRRRARDSDCRESPGSHRDALAVGVAATGYQVAARKASDNRIFREVAESQKAFAARAVRWDLDTNVSRRMAYSHYFDGRPPAKPAVPVRKKS